MIMCVQKVVNSKCCFMFNGMILRPPCALQCVFDEHRSLMFPHVRKERFEIPDRHKSMEDALIKCYWNVMYRLSVSGVRSMGRW